MSEELKVYEEKMEKSIDALLNEYASIRAGRANPHVLDKIKVDYYGTPQEREQDHAAHRSDKFHDPGTVCGGGNDPGADRSGDPAGSHAVRLPPDRGICDEPV